MAMVYPVTSLKQAEEMLLVYTQLSDWDSDLDDAELLDVWTVASTGVGNGRTHLRHNKCMDACLNPKVLPEYLKSLMEWLAEDLTPWEQGELAAAIYE